MVWDLQCFKILCTISIFVDSTKIYFSKAFKNLPIELDIDEIINRFSNNVI